MKVSYEQLEMIREMSTEDLYTLWALSETNPDLEKSLFIECVRYELESRLRVESQSNSVCA